MRLPNTTKKKKKKDKDSQQEDPLRIQGEDSHLQAKEEMSQKNLNSPTP
jgi:hypothetical protein